MSVKKIAKEELETMSNKDITYLLLEEKPKQTTAILYKTIIKLLGLPASTFDKKVGDYYIALANDKRFILLENGKWDLKSRHSSTKIQKEEENLEDDDEDLFEDDYTEEEEDDPEDGFDFDKNNEDYDDPEEDLKGLVIIEEDEIE